ncbi:hypothetical protein LOTGIDRAFT_238666 [Lottia gigantea]|uniref:Uncharacterized protein n=1 Tax=Lottia gigantea TaxID=225164 RepID=V4A861_LOTGI|nr:hypothetical protein LOTGIDRAFT_238666 [Lottia gigantea]ESP00159.1 hypothetical protein LOTGIDRAFT_238666 [Lottia gigantea]
MTYSCLTHYKSLTSFLAVRNLFESSIDPRNKITEFLGVKGILKMTDSTEFMTRTLSETQPSTWIDSDEPCIDVTVYESDESNFTKGNCAKASAIALFSRKIKQSLDLLSKYQGEDDAIFKAVAIAIAGVTDRSSLWKKTCNDLRHGLKQPYLRGMFAFLVAENNDFADVLYDKEIDVKDRVAFACIYLPDDKLHKYFDEFSNNLKANGDLRGLLLTGFTSEGVELVSRFVDVTDDIQTAALISIYCCPNSLDRSDLEKVNMWIEGYRSLLDQWKLYHIRAKFDINRTKFDPGIRNASQVHVRCNFCSKSINSTTTMQMQRSRLPAGISSHAIHKPKTCPNCRKSLPRCSVCLNNLGTASGMGHFHNRDQRNKLTKLADWFTWCQSCRHGGHASHITTWFRDHLECPVTSCSCKCMINCINVKNAEVKL